MTDSNEIIEWLRNAAATKSRCPLSDAAAEIERLRRERDEARAKALDEAAAEVDCGCPNRAEVLTAETKADLWRACHAGDMCGAYQAEAVRQLKDRAP